MERGHTETPASSVKERLPSLRPARALVVAGAGTLRTTRMLLRPLITSDRAEFLRVIRSSREHLDRWSPLHRPGESDEALFERHIELAASAERRLTGWRRAAFLPDGRMAGAFNLIGITRGLQFEGNATWWIAADLVGRGLGVEGVAAMLRHALADLPIGLGLHRVFAGIRPDNAASIAVAERCGLRRVNGPRASLQVAGRWVSHDLYLREIVPAA